MSSPIEVSIRSVEIQSEVAQHLIRRLATDLAELYQMNAEEVNWYLHHVQYLDGGAFLVAFAGETPIGCGMIRRFEEDAYTAEVKRVYVEPDWRQRGVARQLMLALETEASRLGFRKMLLETGTLQVAAIRLYQSLGYQPCPCYGIYANDPLSLCFDKILTPL